MGYANKWDVRHGFFDEVIFAVGALQRFSRIGEESSVGNANAFLGNVGQEGVVLCNSSHRRELPEL
jgi:hypothetical protein